MTARRLCRPAALLCITAAGLNLGQQCAPATPDSIIIPAIHVDPQPQVTVETDEGNMVIELYNQQAPKTVAAFLQYVDEGFYAGTIFHSAIAGKSIAAGTYTADLKTKTGTHGKVANESTNGLLNRRGYVALVEPSGTDSGTSQFLINLADNSSSDYNPETGAYGRTVFGRVIEGLDVADKIGALPTSSQTASDGSTLSTLPTSRLTIVSITRKDTSTTPSGENHPPVASAGTNRSIAPNLTVTLDGAGSTDPDGDRLTYRWEQTSGASVTLSDTAIARPTFVAPSGSGAFTFKLTVDDGREGTSFAEVTLTSIASPSVRLKTSMGDVVVALLDGAPVTTQNFLQYAVDGFYDGTIFHRVMPGFVIQGGGFLPALIQRTATHDAIVNEFSSSRSNLRGTLAMAKVSGDENSATSQFFFNLADSNADNLDNQNGGFTVFARVVEGMNIVNSMAAVETGTATDPDGQEFEDVPVTAIVVNSAVIEPSYSLPTTFTTTDSGLQYKDTAIGTGDIVTAGSTIEILYTGRLTDENGNVFDSSTDPTVPAGFGLDSLIQGWQEGIGEVPIRVGGRRLLIIPPELGYGESGQGDIPPNATLWFDIEVLGVTP